MSVNPGAYPIEPVYAPSGARAYLGWRLSGGSGNFTAFGVGQRITSVADNNNSRLIHTLGSRLPYWAIPMQYEGTVTVEYILSLSGGNIMNLDFIYEAFGMGLDTTTNTVVEKEPSLYEIGMAWQKDSSNWVVRKLGSAVLNNFRISARVGETVTAQAEFRFADASLDETLVPSDCTTATGAGGDLCNLMNNTDTSTWTPLAFYDAIMVPEAGVAWNIQSFDLRLTPNNQLVWSLGDRIASGYFGGRVEGRFSATVIADTNDPIARAYVQSPTTAAKPYNPTYPENTKTAEVMLSLSHGGWVRRGTPTGKKISFQIIVDEVSHPLEVGELITFEVSGYVFGSSITIA